MVRTVELEQGEASASEDLDLLPAPRVARAIGHAHGQVLRRALQAKLALVGGDEEPERLPKTVYVRRRGALTLGLKAADNASGVKRVEVRRRHKRIRESA